MMWVYIEKRERKSGCYNSKGLEESKEEKMGVNNWGD
jgi:hypothetical protein